MQPQASKVENLKRIEDLLRVHKGGLIIAEIARRIGVNRSTVWRYYTNGDLSPLCYEMNADGRIRLDAEKLRFSVNLDLEEAMAIHLAVRLFSKRMDRKNPKAASAIRQIGQEVKKRAPKIGEAMSKSADLIDTDRQIQDATYIQVLKVLTKAWANSSKVHFRYVNEQTGKSSLHTVCPYFIEPYAVGQSTYLFGWADEKEEIRTYKIERIEEIRVLPDTYEIPADFDADRYLADAWGIWTTKGEPERVVLRFSPRVSARVRESLWHHPQEIAETSAGYLLWEAQIANWLEMLPWILGWGAEVEVLEPSKLRDKVIDETRQMAEIYQLKPGF
jgi:CRISPR-associated endonuclease/helicase Cas3